ncbi:unnamed protein product [Heterobilharzia americana]|nr:unnamed protein product [Heterobilharzia americana]
MILLPTNRLVDSYALGRFTSARSDPIHGGSYLCLLEDKASLRKNKHRENNAEVSKFGSRIMHQTSKDSFYTSLNHVHFDDNDDNGEKWISTNSMTYRDYTNFRREQKRWNKKSFNVSKYFSEENLCCWPGPYPRLACSTTNEAINLKDAKSTYRLNNEHS